MPLESLPLVRLLNLIFRRRLGHLKDLVVVLSLRFLELQLGFFQTLVEIGHAWLKLFDPFEVSDPLFIVLLKLVDFSTLHKGLNILIVQPQSFIEIIQSLCLLAHLKKGTSAIV
jgi:hypothetical protein